MASRVVADRALPAAARLAHAAPARAAQRHATTARSFFECTAASGARYAAVRLARATPARAELHSTPPTRTIFEVLHSVTLPYELKKMTLTEVNAELDKAGTEAVSLITKVRETYDQYVKHYHSHTGFRSLYSRAVNDKEFTVDLESVLSDQEEIEIIRSARKYFEHYQSLISRVKLLEAAAERKSSDVWAMVWETNPAPFMNLLLVYHGAANDNEFSLEEKKAYLSGWGTFPW